MAYKTTLPIFDILRSVLNSNVHSTWTIRILIGQPSSWGLDFCQIQGLTGFIGLSLINKH